MIVRRLPDSELELYHHGIKGQKWGVRRYQNPDGSLINKSTKAGDGQQYNLLQRTVRRSVANSQKQKRRELEDWKNVKTIRAQRRSANRMATKEIYAPVVGAATGIAAGAKFGTKSYKHLALATALGVVGGWTVAQAAGKLSNVNHAVVEKYSDYKIKKLEHEIDNIDIMLGRKKVKDD